MAQAGPRGLLPFRVAQRRGRTSFREASGMAGRVANHLLGKTGVHGVGLIVTQEMKWLFTPQSDNDYGIDAHLEVVDRTGDPTGRLVAAQIKAGDSYLREKTATGYVYRGTKVELLYWLGHTLPVIVILYDAQDNVAYWQSVDSTHIKETKKGWKMVVPFNQRLGAAAKRELRHLADGPPDTKRLAQLRVARRWMEIIHDGERLLLEATEWLNKSSGRGNMRLIAQDDNLEERVVEDWPLTMFPMAQYVDVFPVLFPWADISIDEDFYEFYDEQEHDLHYGVWDSEWRESLAKVRPYECDGEVASYRLGLTLNEIGKAFLVLDPYLRDGSMPLPSAARNRGGLKSLAVEYGLAEPGYDPLLEA